MKQVPVIREFKKEFLSSEGLRQKVVVLPSHLAKKKGEIVVSLRGKKERVVLEQILGLPGLRKGLRLSPKARIQLVGAAFSKEEKEAYVHKYGQSVRQWVNYFAAKGQAESAKAVRKALQESSKPGARRVLGYFIARKESGEVIGTAMASVLPQKGTALLEYFIVSPKFKGSGIANALLKLSEDFARGYGAKHLLGEVEPYSEEEEREYARLSAGQASLNAAEKKKLEDLNDKRRRLKYYDKTGFKVDFSWVHAQVPQSPGKPFIPMWLMVKPLQEKEITAQELHEHQKNIYEEIYGAPQTASAVHEFNAAIKELNLQPAGKALGEARRKASEKQER
ncbi:MAG: GNAT family N-acetyltransferase [Candidatus Micrarchaeia archaeon]